MQPTVSSHVTVVAALLLAVFAASLVAGTTADVAITVRLAVTPPANQPPVALTTGPYSTGVGQTITVSGSPSYDPDSGDFIVSWEWDLDNDGLFESSGLSADVSYGDVGTYTIRLRVTDSHGATDVITTTVAVVDLHAVEYKYTSITPISRYVVEYGLAVRFQNDSAGPALDTQIALTAAPPSYSIVRGSAVLGDIAPGETCWSPDDQLVIRQDRRIPLAPGDQFMWAVEYDDADGVHHVVTEVTQVR